MAYHCPICRHIKPRKDYSTCGAPDCVAAWKPLTASQRAKFTEMAEGDLSPFENQVPQAEVDSNLKEVLSPTLPDPKEALDKIFGKKGGTDK